MFLYQTSRVFCIDHIRSFAKCKISPYLHGKWSLDTMSPRSTFSHHKEAIETLEWPQFDPCRRLRPFPFHEKCASGATLSNNHEAQDSPNQMVRLPARRPRCEKHHASKSRENVVMPVNVVGVLYIHLNLARVSKIGSSDAAGPPNLGTHRSDAPQRSL